MQSYRKIKKTWKSNIKVYEKYWLSDKYAVHHGIHIHYIS